MKQLVAFFVFILLVACGNNIPEVPSAPQPVQEAVRETVAEPAVVVTPPQVMPAKPPPQRIAEEPAEPEPTIEAPGERIFSGVVKEIMRPRLDRGRIQSEGGRYYHFYNQTGLIFGDQVTFELDGNGYAVNIAVTKKYGTEERSATTIS